MAEIKIERKPRFPWGWVIPLVAIVAVVWIWAAATDDEAGREVATVDTADRTTGTSGSVGAAVDEYLRFAGLAGDGSSPAEMGAAHEYTAEGLRKLSAALQALTDQDGDTDSRAKFDQFRQVADRIQRDASSVQHANQVREAFTRAAETIDSLENAPDNELQSIAASIQPDRPLLEQQEAVKNFFRESARAVQAAARS